MGQTCHSQGSGGGDGLPPTKSQSYPTRGGVKFLSGGEL